MISEVRIDNLMRLVRNNENAPGFDLKQWFHPCGTFGCLVGNDYLKSGALWAPDMGLWAVAEYGAPATCAALLFGSYELSRGPHGIKCGYVCGKLLAFLDGQKPRPALDREAALNRVRKFIYYVLHKRELLYDDRGCIRESARRTEGDHHVIRRVLSQVNAKELVEA